MKKHIIIIGAGGFGREVYQWCKAAFTSSEYTIKGFLSPNPRDLDGYTIDAPILGSEETYSIQENDYFVFAIGSVETKKKIISKMKAQGAQFLTVIHPTAIIADNCKIGEGVVICPFVILTDSNVIGNFAMLNIYSSCGHEAQVGDFSIMSPYATLNGGAILEEGVFMATHTIVTNSRRVGAGSIIGANSLVMHDVPAASKVIGRSQKPQAA